MAIETLELGSSPYNETCAQVGQPEYATLARAECKRYIELLLTKFGKPPGNAYFQTKSNPHDFGSYYEVVIKYNPNSELEMQFAYLVESNSPATWDDTEVVPFNPESNIDE